MSRGGPTGGGAFGFPPPNLNSSPHVGATAAPAGLGNSSSLSSFSLSPSSSSASPVPAGVSSSSFSPSSSSMASSEFAAGGSATAPAPPPVSTPISSSSSSSFGSSGMALFSQSPALVARLPPMAVPEIESLSSLSESADSQAPTSWQPSSTPAANSDSYGGSLVLSHTSSAAAAAASAASASAAAARGHGRPRSMSQPFNNFAPLGNSPHSAGSPVGATVAPSGLGFGVGAYYDGGGAATGVSPHRSGVVASSTLPPTSAMSATTSFSSTAAAPAGTGMFGTSFSAPSPSSPLSIFQQTAGLPPQPAALTSVLRQDSNGASGGAPLYSSASSASSSSASSILAHGARGTSASPTTVPPSPSMFAAESGSLRRVPSHPNVSSLAAAAAGAGAGAGQSGSPSAPTGTAGAYSPQAPPLYPAHFSPLLGQHQQHQQQLLYQQQQQQQLERQQQERQQQERQQQALLNAFQERLTSLFATRSVARQQLDYIYENAKRIRSLSVKKFSHLERAHLAFFSHTQNELRRRRAQVERAMEEIAARRLFATRALHEDVLVAHNRAEAELEQVLDVLRRTPVHAAFVGGVSGKTLFDFVDTQSVDGLVSQARSVVAVLRSLESTASERYTAIEDRVRDLFEHQAAIVEGATAVSGASDASAASRARVRGDAASDSTAPAGAAAGAAGSSTDASRADAPIGEALAVADERQAEATRALLLAAQAHMEEQATLMDSMATECESVLAEASAISNEVQSAVAALGAFASPSLVALVAAGGGAASGAAGGNVAQSGSLPGANTVSNSTTLGLTSSFSSMTLNPAGSESPTLASAATLAGNWPGVLTVDRGTRLLERLDSLGLVHNKMLQLGKLIEGAVTQHAQLLERSSRLQAALEHLGPLVESRLLELESIVLQFEERRTLAHTVLGEMSNLAAWYRHFANAHHQLLPEVVRRHQRLAEQRALVAEAQRRLAELENEEAHERELFAASFGRYLPGGMCAAIHEPVTRYQVRPDGAESTLPPLDAFPRDAVADAERALEIAMAAAAEAAAAAAAAAAGPAAAAAGAGTSTTPTAAPTAVPATTAGERNARGDRFGTSRAVAASPARAQSTDVDDTDDGVVVVHPRDAR